ncbi:MAG: SufB/SufD family protein [Candidatus Njordarchaeia archaeon]
MKEENGENEEILKKVKEVGLEYDEKKTSGFYLQVDDEIIKTVLIEQMKRKGIIIESLGDALEKYEWVEKYVWSTILKEEPQTIGKVKKGYFIYVPKGLKVKDPIEACFLVSKPNFIQEVHNIVIVDEDAELNMVTGCTSAVQEGLHMGISEFFIKNRGKLTYTMLHNWSPNFKVRPITGVKVGKHAQYISNYINLAPGAWMKSEPVIYVDEGGVVESQSLIVGRKGSFIDYGTIVHLNGSESRAELISRALSIDDATLITRGKIVANAYNTRGHIECKGLMLAKKAVMRTIPELESTVNDADLTHEASIGKISKEQLEYLMARGFTEEEATSLIVRGFLTMEFKGINEVVRATIKQALDRLAETEAL